MADLTFADSHNMVAYLEKSEANADFAEIVDFLNASPIRYALTVSPTIYVSYIEQFWSTAKTKTVNNETQIRAKVDGKTIVITESSVRRDLHFDDEDDKAVHEERGDTMERVTATAASLDAKQDSGGSPRCQEAIGDTIAQTRSERVYTPSYDSPLLGVNTPGSDEDRIELKELMDICTKLYDRVLDLENVYKPRVESSEEILGEKDASKQGRNSDKTKELNVDEDEHIVVEDKDNIVDPVTTAGETVTTTSVNPEDSTAIDVSVGSPTRLVNYSTTDDVTLAETLMAIKSSASRPQKLKGVVFKEPSEPTTTSRPQPQIQAKDKGKGIMQEPEKPVKVKVDSSAKKAENSKKRTRAVLGEESVKRQKVEDDADKAELKACLEIIPDDDSAVNIESLATKYPIVIWKTHILANDIIYYQIIRADGSTKYYKVFSAMLNDFDRQDVLDQYRLVKERFETTSPKGYDRFLWGYLITLFEPKKKYPLTQEMLSRMLSGRVEVDHECEMAFELPRFTKSQLKKLKSV
ncbi:hypothetical protein Tco_0356847 [Tanacetum coccineum]